MSKNEVLRIPFAGTVRTSWPFMFTIVRTGAILEAWDLTENCAKLHT